MLPPLSAIPLIPDHDSCIAFREHQYHHLDLIGVFTLFRGRDVATVNFGQAKREIIDSEVGFIYDSTTSLTCRLLMSLALDCEGKHSSNSVFILIRSLNR